MLLVGACEKTSDRFDEAGEGEGEADVTSPCVGARLFLQTSDSNDAEESALGLDSTGADLVLFGATVDGSAFASLVGHFAVAGYAAGQSVHVQIVDKTCALDSCPTTLGFRFFETINVNSDGACGAADVDADSNGVLRFKATGGGGGGGGGGRGPRW